MGKPHPVELRERVIAFVEEGHTHRAAAEHFRVSPRFVNNMVILKRETGSLLPKRQGRYDGGKLQSQSDWICQRIQENGDLTLDELCVELAPSLSSGDVVIMDSVAFYKSVKVEKIIKNCGAWVLFLPPYSPDLNPIEMAFSKLKTLLRKMAARSFNTISDALGQICDLYTANQCRNYFKAEGYEVD